MPYAVIISGRGVLEKWAVASRKDGFGESLFLRKLVLGIPAPASSKNFTRPNALAKIFSGRLN